MLDHVFFAVHIEDIPNALLYYEHGETFTGSHEHRECFISDELIRNNFAIFSNINVYAQKFEQPYNRLDYHGSTIIPVSTAKEIMSRIASSSLTSNKQWVCLISILKFAIKHNYYVIHIGI